MTAGFWGPWLIFAVGLVPIAWLGRRVRHTDAQVPVARGFAIAICLFTIPMQILQFLPAEWSPRTSLPFQLCDLAWMFAVHALWTGSRLTATVAYLWGITLTTQAMLTPELTSVFPEPRYLMFWAMHILIVWSAVFLVFGLRRLPTWHTYRQTIAITLIWMMCVFVYNSVADTNYGYVNAKPKGASVLDFLGPWPLYLVSEIVIVATVWAVMVWPWQARMNQSPTTGAAPAPSGATGRVDAG